MQRFHGWPKVDPDDVVIVPGGKPTMFYAILMFGEPGAEILYPQPGLPDLTNRTIHFMVRRRCRSRSRSPRLPSIPAAALAQITPRTPADLTTPANPTGGVGRKRELRQSSSRPPRATPARGDPLRRIYLRLPTTATQHTSLLTYDSLRERTILLDGWSKTYAAMTGWRMGFWRLAQVARGAGRRGCRSTPTRAPTPAVQMAGMAALRRSAGLVEKMQRFRCAPQADREGAELDPWPPLARAAWAGAFYAFPNTAGRARIARLESLLLENGVSCLGHELRRLFGEGFLRFVLRELRGQHPRG
ncbi:MAG: hypothetical protein IPJ19_14320 [Planctomycetes bacterium]|nr:hypothetical protein [Planctomycetota bacterium]